MAHCGLAGGRGHDGRSRRIRATNQRATRGAQAKGNLLAPLCVARRAIATGRSRRGGNSNGTAATMRQQQQHGCDDAGTARQRQDYRDGVPATARQLRSICSQPFFTHSTRYYLGNHPFCAHGFEAKPPLVGGSLSAEPPPLRKRLGQYCESVRTSDAPIHSGVTRRGHVRIQAFMSRRKSWSARQTR